MLQETLIFSIPEAIVITWLAITLLGSPVKLETIILMGIATGLATSILRPLAGSYVINVIIYVAILVLILSLFKVAAFWERIASVVMAVPIYLIIEFINMQVVITVFNLSPELIISDFSLRIRCFMPQLLAATLVAILLTKFRVTLFIKDDQV